MSSWILGESEITLDDVFQKACCWLLKLSLDHIVEDSADGEKSLCRHAKVIQSIIVEQDLLDNEGSDSLRQICAPLHDPQTKRNDLCLQEEVDDRWIINFDKGSYNS